MEDEQPSNAVLASRLSAVERNLDKVLDKLDDGRYVRADQLEAAANSWDRLLVAVEERVEDLERWQTWAFRTAGITVGTGIVGWIVHLAASH